MADNNKDIIFHFRLTNKTKIKHRDEVLETLSLWKRNKKLSEMLLLLVDNYITNEAKQQEHQEISQKLQSILEIFNSLSKAEKQIIFNILYPEVIQDRECYKNQEIYKPKDINPINTVQAIFQAEKPVELPKIKTELEEDEEDPYRD